jgi:CubicO group peptidase (beta-lactamase class C family)
MRRMVLFALLFLVGAPASANDPWSAERLKRIEAHVEALRAAGSFNGSILVARGDKVVISKGYGFADLENSVPLRSNSVFRLGSLTKPVTASAVLMAVEARKIGLETPLCSVLDYCLASWKAVTIAQLLSHTSGIKDHFGDLEAVPVEQTVAELKRVLSRADPAEPLKAPAGSNYAYSNFNYLLLGAVLESVYKRPWHETIVQTVSHAAGAPSLDYDDVFAILPHRVRGYDRTKSGAFKNIAYKDHAAYAAGGLRATIEDFFRWSRASLGGKLFSPGLRDRMLTPRIGRYGYGWQIAEFFGERAYNHNGGIDGFSTHIVHYPAPDATIIVFSNVESDIAQLVACDVAGLLLGYHERKGTAADRISRLRPEQRCGLDR